MNSFKEKQILTDQSNTLKGSQTVRNLKSSAFNSWEVTALDLSQINLIKKKVSKKKFQNIIILVINILIIER
jgi:hypothetical protein